ncbi:Protein-export membrane protein SecG [Candidatus Gullanella endobia]|uniref:Protein-export membrane protein SecG n=1 Tax=Candidatus Gullanella endobia TaxID=1070130 RepID=A0A143WQR5_9ENTR|nr:preprotein translocase subunit SecG [Candidatus Gullanella endobia]CUX96116.1 Protein-export membrane protein SecG [Candidatus Gullanella endobia]
MYKTLLIMFLLVGISLVALIILQQNKGTGMGSLFSINSPSTFFGSSGSGNFIVRMTVVLATLFFVFSLILNNLSTKHVQKDNQWDNLNQVYKVDDKEKTEVIERISNDIP